MDEQRVYALTTKGNAELMGASTSLGAPELLCGAAAVSFSAGAANNDDGFIWIDANTKIKLKPIGSAAAGGTKAPEPKKEKKEKPKK
jgi:hypothetical protein